MSGIGQYLEKLRIWGVRGVFDFLRAKWETRKFRQFLIWNAKAFPCATPEKGITIIADFRRNHSFGKVVRDFALSLKDAQIPFQVLDTGKRSEVSRSEADALVTPRKDFRLRRYANVVDVGYSPLPVGLGLRHGHIVFWEFESGLLEFAPRLVSPSTVIAMSDFNVEYFRRALPLTTPVRKILYPFRFERGELESVEIVRKRYGIGADDFVVFFNFSFGSSVFRKNPDGAIHAFAKSFADEPKSKLVFKTNHTTDYPDAHVRLRNLALSLGVANRLVFIEDYLSQRDLYGLTNACDVYLSLHRGEGFGLGVVEAMSLGKPVIVTDYSSITEFCRPENAFLVPYQIVPYNSSCSDIPAYSFVKTCAEPDVDAAAECLRTCFRDPVLRRSIGDHAKSFVESYFSIENFGRSLQAFLDSDR